MLGIILIYWVGKAFYELAHEYNRNKWAFAILGVVSYYAGILLGGVALGVVLEIASPGYVNEDNERWLGFLTIPLGVLTCWGTYTLLKKSWSKPPEISKHTLDSELIPSDTPRYNREER